MNPVIFQLQTQLLARTEGSSVFCLPQPARNQVFWSFLTSKASILPSASTIPFILCGTPGFVLPGLSLLFSRLGTNARVLKAGTSRTPCPSPIALRSLVS